jgi:hypothetical protein
MRTWVDEAAAVFARHKGITEVEASPITGSVLIHYDPDQLGGQEVVAYFNRFIRFGVDQLDTLRELPAGDRGPYIRELLESQPWVRGGGR